MAIERALSSADGEGLDPAALRAGQEGAIYAGLERLAEHLTSEYRVKTEGRGWIVDEWKLRASGLDSHWLDCLVGCAVTASMEGAVLFGTQPSERKRERIKLSELR